MPLRPFDSLLVLSFGGPERPEDVMPFLENVVRGRPVPRERLEEVAEHYQLFGGVSPIGAQNRALVEAVGKELAARGAPLPVYLGNRNWHPFVEDAVAAMKADGVTNAFVFVTSAFGSYNGCRQYREDLERAMTAAGRGSPELHKSYPFFDNPGFYLPLAESLRAARARAGPDAPLLFSAHSIPVSMAASSPYEEQLRRTATLVAEASGGPDWRLVYQSGSGSQSRPWLGPDVGEELESIAAGSAGRAVIISPIGFVSDHMEVIYDLDIEAASLASDLGLQLVRAGTAGTHPLFVSMVADMVQDGPSEAHHVTCHAGCCLSGRPPLSP